jgi:hypothetical protein
VELQDSLAGGAEVVLRSQAAVGAGLLHIQAVIVVVGLLHIQTVAVGVGLLHNQDWDHLQDSPAAEVVELPHILVLDAQGVGLQDSPVVGLQGSPVVGVLHFQGMAEQELLVEEPPPQDMLLQGSQTSVKSLFFLQKGPTWSMLHSSLSFSPCGSFLTGGTGRHW